MSDDNSNSGSAMVADLLHAIRERRQPNGKFLGKVSIDLRADARISFIGDVECRIRKAQDSRIRQGIGGINTVYFEIELENATLRGSAGSLACAKALRSSIAPMCRSLDTSGIAR